MDAPCTCVKRHVPAVASEDVHHIWPLSWGGPDTPSNRIALCPTTHHNTHALLNEYVHAGGLPAAAVLRRFPAFARALAQRGWEAHQAGNPSHPTPYW